MMKLGITRYTNQTGWEFEVWLQPYRYWIIGILYRMYDAFWYKTPGITWLARKIDKRSKFLWSDDPDDLPWSVKRDERLFFLSHKRRVIIVQRVPLTEEQNQALKGHGEI